MITSQKLLEIYGLSNRRFNPLLFRTRQPEIKPKHNTELFFMLDHHDSTFEYSDDSCYYSNGKEEKALILAKIVKTLHLDKVSAHKFYDSYYGRY